MILHLSPPSLPHLSPGCPPLDSHCLEVRCGCSGPHESTLVSRAVGALSNLHLSPSCLPLPGSALDQLSPSWVPGSPLSKKGVDALDLLILDLSPTCLQCAVGALGRNDSHYECFGPHDSAVASHLSPSMLWMLWAAWFYTCHPLFPRLSPTVLPYALGCLGRLILHLFPACFPLFPSMLWALWATCLYTWWRAKKLSATKQSLYMYIYIYIIFVFSVSIIHLIIGVPDFDLYALVSCLSLTVAKYSVGALWSAWLTLPLVPHGFQVCCMILAAGLALSRCLVYALGLWAAWLHTCLPFVLQIRLIPDLPACLQLGSQLFPICKCSLGALGCTCFQLVYQHLPVCCGCSELHGSTLAPHLSPTGPPCVCKSIVGVLGRTINSTLMSPLSPTCLRLSPSMQWVLCTFPGLSPRILWMFCAAWTCACLPFVSYCLQISCGCSGLQEATLVSLLSSTVSQYAVVWVL